MAIPTITFDVEDPRPRADLPQRYDIATRAVLDFLEQRQVRGTFFVVGSLAKIDPGLVRDIASRGHEIALHGWDHTPIDQVDRATLPDDLARGQALLEDLSGQRCCGFRAPIFSLIPETRWLTDVLLDLNFDYSSSVLPARNPLYGDPTAPHHVFRWSNGLLELPVPLRGIGPLTVPILGGVYVRYAPRWFVRRALGSMTDAEVPWTYGHPYDFDPDEQFYVMHGTSWLTSRILFSNRRASFRKLGAIIDGGVSAPFADRANAGEFADAPLLSAA
jgi:polysaccharide deacetylase family protein (PEP-CTERM system associated)